MIALPGSQAINKGQCIITPIASPRRNSYAFPVPDRAFCNHPSPLFRANDRLPIAIRRLRQARLAAECTAKEWLYNLLVNESE